MIDLTGLMLLFRVCTNQKKHCLLAISNILNLLDIFQHFSGSTGCDTHEL